jgi:hypothetical protein
MGLGQQVAIYRRDSPKFCSTVPLKHQSIGAVRKALLDQVIRARFPVISAEKSALLTDHRLSFCIAREFTLHGLAPCQ